MRLARREDVRDVEARLAVAFLAADVRARDAVALRVLARLVMDAFLTVAARFLAREETRAFLTGARYAGTEKAASESATSLAIFET